MIIPRSKVSEASNRLKQNVRAVPEAPLAALSHVRFLTLLREPFARLLSQFRHDKYYTPRMFKSCLALEALVERQEKSCIQNGEPAYRYQNFQTMMLGGCVWDHRLNICEQTKHSVKEGGGFITPSELLASFFFVGINEHFEASVCLFYDSVGDRKAFRSFCRGKRAVPHVMQGSWITKKESANGGRAVLDSSVLRAAVRTNELDFKLYWAAYDSFVEKIKVLESRENLALL